VIALALEVPVIGRALLTAVGLIDGAVHIKDQILQRSPLADLVNSVTRKIHQLTQIVFRAEDLCLEPTDLAVRGSLLLGLAGSAINQASHGWVYCQSLGIFDIFASRQSIVDRLT
jgi:hypothetical protein